MNSSSSLWLGYGQAGGRTTLRHEELRGRLLLLGDKANDLAALVACAYREVGLRTMILDMDGSLTDRVSGYFQPYDFSYFFNDVAHIEEQSAMHGQLLAAAYTAALDLSSEEESIVNAALRRLVSQDNMANPSVLFNSLGDMDGFRGFYVDKLKGRIASFKDLDAADNGSFRRLLTEDSIVSFRKARYTQAMELALAFFIAKLLAVIPDAQTRPDVLIVSGAHHLFKSMPRPQHGNRLLIQLLETPMMVVFASELKSALNPQLIDGCPVKIVSSDVWNEEDDNDRALPNTFVIDHGHFGHSIPFVARQFERKVSEPVAGALAIQNDEELTKIILQDIQRYEASTRPSLVAFLSGPYSKEAVEKELTRLHNEGFIELESNDVRSGPPILAYVLTEKGERYIEGATH